MTAGSYFVDARYKHIPTATGPGHALILSGAAPYKTGIVGNDWYDRATKAHVYCVDDPRQKVVGAAPGSSLTPMGPLHMLSTTVGDELKLGTAGASKVVTVSLKDRAAILLGGHMQDVSVWYDPTGGRWVSSTAYCKGGKLPDWVEKINDERIPDKTLGTTWTPSLPAEVIRTRTLPTPDTIKGRYGLGPSFPHKVGAEKTKENYNAFTLTPAASGFVFETAKRAIAAEKLGQRGDTPDLLALNLATNDYVGHAYGPYSAEALDITVQTDRLISDFLNYVDKTVPGGLKECVVVVTADHGVAPVPKQLEERDAPSGQITEEQLADAADRALTAAFGGGPYVRVGGAGDVGVVSDAQIYLSEDAVAAALAGGKATSRTQIEETVAHAIEAIPGVYACYTRTQINEGRLPHTDIGSKLALGYHARLGGDVVVITDPDFFPEYSYGTTHGTPYVYDAHVPILIAGAGVRPGVWADPVSPMDIAPTLCTLLGIEYPSGCDGRPLRSALGE
jgi:hypothetical protein